MRNMHHQWQRKTPLHDEGVHGHATFRRTWEHARHSGKLFNLNAPRFTLFQKHISNPFERYPTMIHVSCPTLITDTNPTGIQQW